MKKLTFWIVIMALVISVAGWFVFKESRWGGVTGGEVEEEIPQDDSHDVESVTVRVKVGEPVEALGESVTVLEVLEDSRCPVDVQCIQAGTVRVRTELTSGLGVSEQIFELSIPITTEVNSFELIGVQPEARSDLPIDENEYIFTFEVTER